MDIQFRDVSFTYEAGTPIQHTALKNINLTIQPHKITAIVGRTGSGKSTLVQHMNALLKPTSGVVRMGSKTITANTSNRQLKALRKSVGTVFQFPEAQLFGQTIAEDIMFGPQNYGVNEKEALEIAKEVLQVVGLDESFLDVSPFDLSGGQQRRVAIAGVLALKPEVLVLDEPTAGLDPKGQKEMMNLFDRLNKEKNMTIILVTHRMEHVAEYADDVIIMKDGVVVQQDHPREIFKNTDLLQLNYLDVPNTISFANGIKKKFGWKLEKMPLTTDELAQSLKKYFFETKGENE